MSLYKYAGFWKRFAAHIIDQIILGFVRSILLIPVWVYVMMAVFRTGNDKATEDFVMIGGDYMPDISFQSLLVFIVIVSFISVIIDWLYYALMESSVKQATLGKMVMSIKVTSIEGSRISFGKASARYFGKIISAVILMIGYIMAGFTEKKQALHDILANCLVVNTLYLENGVIHTNNNSGEISYGREGF